MKRARIDFAPAGLRRTLWRAPAAAWAMVLLSVALGVSLGADLVRYQRRLQAYEERLREHAVQLAQAHQRAAAGSSARAAVPKAQALAVNAAVMRLNLPWVALRDIVREATPDSVALLAIEPDATRRTLRITAEAGTSDAMLAYVGRLQRQDGVATAALTRHETNERDPNRPLRFQIDAQWKPNDEMANAGHHD
jgi:Tfp pilus assembly protein PilN